MAKRKPLSNAEKKQRVDDFIKLQMDTFIDIIQKNQTNKWEKPWKDMFGGLGSLPHNPATKHRYQGSNVLFLMIDMMLRKTNDPRYLTLPQAKRYADEHGMDPRNVRIKKGEKAAYILKPIIIGVQKKEDQQKGPDGKGNGQPNDGGKPGRDRILDELTGTGSSKPDPGTKTGDKDNQDDDGPVFLRFKIEPRFSATSLTGIPSLQDLKEEMAGGEKVEPHSLVSHFVASSQANLREGTEAKYSFKRSDPTDDYIEMPPIQTFEEPDQWASTLLHEMFHYSGGFEREKRLIFDRKETKEEYAREEIRAQMFMVSASAALGLPIKLDQEADYVKGFGDRSNLDYKQLYKEFKASNKIFSEVLIPFLADEQPTVDWFPDKSTWPERSEDAKLEAVKATARVLTPTELTPPSPTSDDGSAPPEPEPYVLQKLVNKQNSNTKSETNVTVDSLEPVKKAETKKPALDMGIFDLIPEDKAKPAQMDLFSVLDDTNEKQEEDFGMRMR